MNSEKVTRFLDKTMWWGLALLALFSRFYFLENKPIHFDEGINGWFVMQMQSLGFYKYDPQNYHGPLYFYLLQGAESLWGRSLSVLRTVPAIFSFLSVMLFSYGILSSKSFQRAVALFILLSPAFIFFGRSGIHEMPFVSFQLLFALGVLRWLEKPDGKAMSLVFVGVWGLLLLKETFVITFFCWGLALLSLGWREIYCRWSWTRLKQAWTPAVRSLVLILTVSFILIYTGFLRNPMGLWDFVKALLPWLKTGVHGNGHEKEFFYWIKVLWQAEPLALVGVLVSFVGVFSSTLGLRMLSVFSLSQLLVYSFIPYKTVWCILTLVWGFYFVLAWYWVQAGRQIKILLSAVMMPALLWNGWSIYQSSYRAPIDMEHPYVYVNSTYQLSEVVETLHKAIEARPELREAPVQVGHREQWPWPWLMWPFKNVDYNLCGKKVNESALLYVCDIQDATVVDASLSSVYWKIAVELRQGKVDTVVYFRKAEFPEAPLSLPAELVGREK